MKDKIQEILKQPWTVPTVIGVLSFGGGLGVGYLLAKRKLNQSGEAYEVPKQLLFNFDEDEKVEKEPFEEMEIEQPSRPPKVVITEEEAVKKDILKVDSLSQLRPSMLEGEEEPVEDVVVNVFDEPAIIVPETTAAIEWDWEEEVRNRTETAPYVLHKEEFYEDEKNYSQQSLIYYAVDAMLADEDSAPVYNHHLVTGPLLFGHGSGDPDVVYIRNDERRAEYEITRVDGLYSVEVLGLEIENNERVSDLKHAKQPTKFRMD